MGIFSRLSDIVNSNINALLDRAEDPEKMVRLIIQEMEETLVEVRTTSARAIADKKELNRRKTWLARESGEWERKATVALQKNRDDLARLALMEKGRLSGEVGSVDAELAQIDDSLIKLNEDISMLQQKIVDAKARQKSIVIRGQTATSRLDVRRQLANTNIDDAMERFEHYERKIDDLEGEAESYDLGQRSLAEEIRDLEADEEINAELARLKQGLNGSHERV